jgi:hypothetical protein
MPQEFHHQHFHFRAEKELKITITRGQRGNYGWEISYTGAKLDEVLNTIKEADKKLRKMFLGDKDDH